jgi:serine/threonine protein kinase
MTAERPNAELIFHRALDIQGRAERAAYLEQACQGDAKLSAEVEALIRFHERAGDFLNTPALAPGTDLATGPVTEGPGTVIGHYKLLERIGEGGMAVVYMAQQQEPIQRQVALKLIKLGMASDPVIARFEAERQALALMDHPNIAKVLDAGTTESGRPYFVMELVKGVSITRFCDKNTLNTQDRLNLFRAVCQAVHHAHQKGVIHRDIKPSNVMVTLHDGRAVPKVIDFGIAKAIHQRLTEKTLFTHYAQIIGTPQYMSPEQAEMSGLDVDTRTDVYSLGILLYELLTGRAPFEGAYLRSKGYAEMQRIIREEEPTKPSTKISTLGEALIDIAELRDTNPDALRRLMRADLDWIVMKTLEKERTRRYDSARELSADIERHLRNEPVLAGPPSLWYSSKKFLRRHQTLALTAVAVVLALLVGFVVSRFQFESKARRNRQFSAVQCLYAEGRYQAALNTLEAFGLHKSKSAQISLLYAQALHNVGRTEEAVRELNGLADSEPAIAGAAHYVLARVYLGVNAAEADAHRKRAESLAPHSAYGHTLRALAASTPDEALPWLDKAVNIGPGDYDARKARSLVHYGRRDFANMRHDVEVLIGMRAQGSLGYSLRALALREMGELERALADHTQAIELCETDTELPVLLDQRQETLWRMGDHQAALQDAQRCVDLAPEIADYAVALGKNLFKLGRYEDARREFSRIKDKAWKQVVMVMMRYAFDSASEDELLDMPDSMQETWPFFWMFHYVDLYRSLTQKATRLLRGTLDISSWPQMDVSWHTRAPNSAGGMTAL